MFSPKHGPKLNGKKMKSTTHRRGKTGMMNDAVVASNANQHNAGQNHIQPVVEMTNRATTAPLATGHLANLRGLEPECPNTMNITLAEAIAVMKNLGNEVAWENVESRRQKGFHQVVRFSRRQQA
ncbi:hypothetical protein ACOSP7_014961 [Xanthoceras sorbifolium]